MRTGAALTLPSGGGPASSDTKMVVIGREAARRCQSGTWPAELRPCNPPQSKPQLSELPSPSDAVLQPPGEGGDEDAGDLEPYELHMTSGRGVPP